MQKNVLIYFFLILASFLFSETIVDTLYSIPQLDGIIVYNTFYDTYVSDTLYPNNPVGDCWSGIDGTVSYGRVFFVFNLPNEIEGYNLINATAYMYQIGSYGNSIDGAYPIFNLTNGDVEPPCLIEHVDLGIIMDIDEFDTPALHPAEILTDTTGQAWKDVNVFDWVNDDLENDRTYFQARLRLSLDTDNDMYDDCIHFSMGSSWHHMPYIVYEYESDTGIEEELESINTIQLSNHPNPFNPQTTITYLIADPGNVQLQIYNTKGQLIKTLVDKMKGAGDHSVEWNAESQASGIYLYRITSGTETKTGRCLLLK